MTRYDVQDRPIDTIYVQPLSAIQDKPRAMAVGPLLSQCALLSRRDSYGEGLKTKIWAMVLPRWGTDTYTRSSSLEYRLVLAITAVSTAARRR
jgi:hypothetical protein